jgi:hypothetical protein
MITLKYLQYRVPRGNVVTPVVLYGCKICYLTSRREHILKVEKSSDLIGNRTRDLPASSIMPQPTTLPRASICRVIQNLYSYRRNYSPIHYETK